jgi:DNA-binding transcriptional ArsR family regulator
LAARPGALPPHLLNPQFVKALAHSTRVHIMSVTNARIATPKELATELGETVNNVTYHINVLKRLGCIELAEEREVQGGRVVEHFYRAVKLQYFDAEGWERLNPHEKLGVVMPILRLISVDLNEAMAKGTYLEPDDNHLSRTPLVVDELGRLEVNEILDRALHELLEVRERSAERIAGSDAEIHVNKVAILHFRSPEDPPPP